MIFNLENIAILGASGAIGSAFTMLSSENYPNARMFMFSRNDAAYRIGYSSEYSIAEAAEVEAKEKPLDLVIVANSALCDKALIPERSLRDLSAEKLYRIFKANTIKPALTAKRFRK